MTDAADSTPLPPRYRWLRRLTVAYLLLAAGTVALRYLWLGSARGRVDAQLDGYRRAGQPVLATELAPVPVPNAQNAVPLLRSAAKGIVYSRDEMEVLNSLTAGGPTAAEMTELCKIVDRRRQVLAPVRRARGML